MIDINVRSDYKKLRHLIYTNKRLNGNFVTLKDLIAGQKITLTNLVQDFSALDLSRENNFKSLLFYQGLVTIHEKRLNLTLKIPNETIKRIDIDFLADSLELEKIFKLDINNFEVYLEEFATSGNIEVFRFFASEINRNTSMRDYITKENTIKAMYLAYFSLTNYYVVKSEPEMNKGFADIFMIPFNPYVEYFAIIEVKYIKRDKDKKADTKLIQTLKDEATTQLLTYEKDNIVQKHIKNGVKLKKIILIFYGWELVELAEV